MIHQLTHIHFVNFQNPNQQSDDPTNKSKLEQMLEEKDDDDSDDIDGRHIPTSYMSPNPYKRDYRTTPTATVIVASSISSMFVSNTSASHHIHIHMHIHVLTLSPSVLRFMLH